MTGSPGVFVNGLPAARLGDATAKGGLITTGCLTVLIGTIAGGASNAPAQSLTKISLNDAAKKSDLGVFRRRFKQEFGLSTQGALKKFRSRTGRELSENSLAVLFADPIESAKAINKFEELDTTLRDILNTNVPATLSEAKARGFVEIPQSKNLFHDPENNVKYVSPNGGHVEGIYNKKSGKLETNPAYKATANFFGPDEWLGHIGSDVLPWVTSSSGMEWTGSVVSKKYNNFLDNATEMAQNVQQFSTQSKEFTQEKIDEIGNFVSNIWQNNQ